MTIQLDVQDLENYPGTSKRVTLDTEVIVPTGTEGDEKYLLVASTSAYSDNTNRTAIQDLYVAGGVVGWTKSSGFKGTNGKFELDASTNTFSVRMDETVSGTAGGGYYDVVLEHEEGVPMRGDDIALDMQDKIRAITMDAVDEGYQLAYKNCSVKFSDNKFWISSGTVSNRFTGSGKSAVHVAAGSSNDCHVLLGFDQQVYSSNLAGITLLEAPLSVDYTAGDTTMTVLLATGINAGDALCVTDGTNTDYFIASSFSGGAIGLSSDSVLGVAHDYTTVSGSYVQVMKKNDPDNKPNSYYADTDGLLRYMAKIMINQIDFSS